jgi:tetratricopeptide (TPR) repeat protein
MNIIVILRRARKKRGTALAGAVALLLLLRGPMLVSVVWGNAGMLTLRDELIAQADFAPGTYPVFDVLDDTPATARALQDLRRAAELGGGRLAAQWALGRAALAVGDAETAADALGPLAGSVGRNLLLYDDALTALSHGGRPEGVIAFYESAPPPQPTQAISDAVALAYLERGRGAGEQASRRALERAKELRPGDLYANCLLWQRAQAAGDAEAAAAYSEMLTHFPLEAVHPADERLLDYVAEVAPALLEDGLWHREKMIHVISFLVSEHENATGVECLLGRLVERYPTEPDWRFYLAELYHRRGELERAEAAYRQVLETDATYAQACLCLGMIYEERAGREMEE